MLKNPEIESLHSRTHSPNLNRIQARAYKQAFNPLPEPWLNPDNAQNYVITVPIEDDAAADSESGWGCSVQ
jgi:hypothetical protein